MVDVLNLAGADTSGPDFDPVPTGWYPCDVKKMEDKFTKGGPDAALPAGTPMINVHLRIQDGYEIEDGGNTRNVGGKYLFKQLIIPPPKIEGKAYEHYKQMMGQLANFFICLGFDEALVLGGEFDISDRSQFIDLPIGVRARKYNNKFKGELDNEVQGFKPVGELAIADTVGGLV